MNVGALLVVGFDGTSLPRDLEKSLREGNRAGIILFRRNVVDMDQVHALCHATLAAATTDLPPIVSVDQEGGRVARLHSPCLKVPPARKVGERGPSLVERVAEAQARELRALGFNLNFAPVLDIHTNEANPIIGDRAYGTTAEDVALRAAAYIRGAHAGGLLTCGKHFPGHGDTSQDSHLVLPIQDNPAEVLRGREFVPFQRAIAAGVDAFMSAHVVYPRLDPATPATLSKTIVTDILREEMNFEGVLFSDDLEMKALSEDTGENAVLSIAAGCDLLLICATEARQMAAEEALRRECEKSAAFRARVEEALMRATAMRRKVRPMPTLPSFPELVSAHGALAAELAAL